MNGRWLQRNAKWMVAIIVFAGLLASRAPAMTVDFQDGYANFFTADNVYTGTQDTFFWALMPDLTFSGGRPEMWLREGANPARSLLRFDLSSFAGQYASVTSLTVRLTTAVYAASLAGTGTVHWISAANKNWVEGTVNGVSEPGSPCWNWRRYNTNAWAGSKGLSTADTDYDSTVLGTFSWPSSESIGTVHDIAIAGTTEQLTALVALMTNASSNAGFLLHSTTPDEGHEIYFSTSDNTPASLHPRLRIGYVPVTSSVSTIAVTYRDGETNRFTGGSAYTGTTNTWLWNYTPNDNYGGRDDLWVGQANHDIGFAHTLLRFDLSSFEGKFISATGITLRLTMHSLQAAFSCLSGTGVVYWISAANKDWIEGTGGSGQPGSPCWNWRRYNTNSWAGAPGLNTSETDYDSLNPWGTFTWAASEAAGTTHDIVFQGGAMELMWLIKQMTNMSSNAGFLIRGLVDADPDTRNHLAVFASSKHATVSYRPQLTINYIAPPPPRGAVVMFR